ncbi:hypothetical protein V8G54_013252 [Vigna mungo]|uniref:Uncharacterized protein n=1 Tax=Vigna mungo TaxID=3915 RepID=A0AAQ3NSM3_VIGMU
MEVDNYEMNMLLGLDFTKFITDDLQTFGNLLVKLNTEGFRPSVTACDAFKVANLVAVGRFNLRFDGASLVVWALKEVRCWRFVGLKREVVVLRRFEAVAVANADDGSLVVGLWLGGGGYWRLACRGRCSEVVLVRDWAANVVVGDVKAEKEAEVFVEVKEAEVQWLGERINWTTEVEGREGEAHHSAVWGALDAELRIYFFYL